MDINSSNPCKQCLVDPMCTKFCDKLALFLKMNHDVPSRRDNFWYRLMAYRLRIGTAFIDKESFTIRSSRNELPVFKLSITADL